MKLIDLNQTIFVPIEDETQGGATYEIQMTVAEMFDKFFEGNTPEVVDAVPVEFLEEAIGRYEYDGCTDSADVVKALIDEWNRKQKSA